VNLGLRSDVRRIARLRFRELTATTGHANPVVTDRTETAHRLRERGGKQRNDVTPEDGDEYVLAEVSLERAGVVENARVVGQKRQSDGSRQGLRNDNQSRASLVQ